MPRDALRRRLGRLGLVQTSKSLQAPALGQNPQEQRLWFLTSLEAEVGVELEAKRRRELQFMEAAVLAVADIPRLGMPRQIWQTQAIQLRLQREEMAEFLGAQQQRQEEQQPLRAQRKGLLLAHREVAQEALELQQQDQEERPERMARTRAARLILQPRQAVRQEVIGDQRLEVAAEDVQRQLLLRGRLAGLMFHLDLMEDQAEHYQPQLTGGMATTEV